MADIKAEMGMNPPATNPDSSAYPTLPPTVHEAPPPASYPVHNITADIKAEMGMNPPATNPDSSAYPTLPPTVHEAPPPASYPEEPPHSDPTPIPPNPPIQTIIVGSPVFNQNPVTMTCPHCHQQIITRIEPKIGLLPWLLCGIMTLLGCWICCFIPFCADTCKDIEHTCPNCNKLLGTYERM